MKIRLFGVPSCAGALELGLELAPAALRRAGFVTALRTVGHAVVDCGDLLGSQTLPRHNEGEVRNWPAPKMVWSKLSECSNLLFGHNDFTLILGGDCSLAVGTFTAFKEFHGDKAFFLVLDGQVDAMAPCETRCVGAAAMWLWFLTHSWDGEWKNPGVSAKNICVIGPRDTAGNDDVFAAITASELEHSQEPPAVQHFLNNLPADASIFVHFDVDVLRDSVMPAAYSPNPNGVDLGLTQQTLRYILSDSRVRGIEITEFCPIKDRDGSAAQLIVDLLRSSFPDI